MFMGDIMEAILIYADKNQRSKIKSIKNWKSLGWTEFRSVTDVKYLY